MGWCETTWIERSAAVLWGCYMTIALVRPSQVMSLAFHPSHLGGPDQEFIWLPVSGASEEAAGSAAAAADEVWHGAAVSPVTPRKGALRGRRTPPAGCRFSVIAESNPNGFEWSSVRPVVRFGLRQRQKQPRVQSMVESVSDCSGLPLQLTNPNAHLQPATQPVAGQAAESARAAS